MRDQLAKYCQLTEGRPETSHKNFRCTNLVSKHKKRKARVAIRLQQELLVVLWTRSLKQQPGWAKGEPSRWVHAWAKIA